MVERSNQYSIGGGLRARGSWLLAAFLIATWLAGLLLERASFAGLAILIVEAAVVLCLLLSLSERARWKPTMFLFLGGLALRVVEIMFIQTLPNYADVPPDTMLYDFNAQALVDHWRGLEVVAEDYYLLGLAALQNAWLPTDWFGYASVFGSRSFLYQVYVGAFYLLAGPQQTTVILSNTVLLAALAPAVYNMSNLLFDSRRIGILAASLVLADPNFAAVGAFLLRDSLITLLMAIALWMTVLVIRKPRAYYPMVVLVVALLSLSLLRYHVLMAFWLAVVIAVLVLTYYHGRAKWLLAVLLPFCIGSMALLLLKDSLAAFSTAIALWATVLIVGKRRAYYPILALVGLVAALLGLAMFYPGLMGFALAAGIATFAVAATWRVAVLVVGERRAYYPVVALVVLAAALLGGLSPLLYHVLAVFWLAVTVAVVVMVYYRGGTRRLLAVLALSLVGSMALYTPSSFLDPISQAEAASVQKSAEAVQTMSYSDQTTFSWLQAFREDPILSLAKTTAHTLFAPYPWVPLFNELNYNSIELFYPGTVMWIMGLPFLFVALWRLLIRGSSELARGSPELLVILLWAFLVVLVYVAFQGEFSTRSRVFMMPLLWTLIAFGIEQVRIRFDRAKAAG